MNLRFFSSRRFSMGLYAMLFAMAVAGTARAQYLVSNTWSIAAGSRTYVTVTNTERSIAYNPITGHVLLVSRTDANGNRSDGTPRIAILDGDTGGELGFMDVTGISGGTFALSQIAVADDGAIYAANLTTSAPGSPYRLYRWENESAAPVSVYSQGAPGAGARWGETIDIRGSGLDTEILVGGNSTAAAIFRPTDDTYLSFTPITINVTGVSAGELQFGLAFGTNDTFYSRLNTATTVRYIAFDRVAGTGTILTTYTVDVQTSALAYNTNTTHLAAVRSPNATTGHRLLIYDLSTGTTPVVLGQINFPGPATLNGNRVGGIDLKGDRVYAVSTQNGVVAGKIIFAPEPRVTTQPLTHTVVEGGYTSLSVDAAGVPPITYQWYLNNSPLGDQTNRTLSLTNVTPAQGGNYTVAVSNSYGGALSSNAVLTVDPTVLSSAMTLLWQLSPGSRPYINTDGTQRGLAYNPANNHVLLVSRTGSNAIHVLHGDTGAYLWSMNVDSTIVTGGTFAINMVDVTDDGVVYACNLTQDGGFKIYKWADDSESSVPERVWGPANPSGVATVVRWGDAMDLRGSSLNPAMVVTSRNTNYVSIIELWDPDRPPKVAHLDTLSSGAMGLGVAFGADTASGAYTVWGKSTAFALRQVELLETSVDVFTPTILATVTGYLNMGPIGVQPASNLLAGISIETPDNVRLLDIANATADSVFTVDTEFFPTDNANGNGTGNVAFGPNRIYALDSNNGLQAWSYSYERTTCVPGNIIITRTSATELQISWTEPGQRLQSNTELSDSPSWDLVSGTSPVTIQTNGEKMFFRLICP